VKNREHQESTEKLDPEGGKSLNLVRLLLKREIPHFPQLRKQVETG
jgi:hypothetical protein